MNKHAQSECCDKEKTFQWDSDMEVSKRRAPRQDVTVSKSLLLHPGDGIGVVDTVH